MEAHYLRNIQQTSKTTRKSTTMVSGSQQHHIQWMFQVRDLLDTSRGRLVHSVEPAWDRLRTSSSFIYKNSHFWELFLHCLNGDSYTNASSKVIDNHIDPLSLLVMDVSLYWTCCSRSSWASASATPWWMSKSVNFWRLISFRKLVGR